MFLFYEWCQFWELQSVQTLDNFLKRHNLSIKFYLSWLLNHTAIANQFIIHNTLVLYCTLALVESFKKFCLTIWMMGFVRKTNTLKDELFNFGLGQHYIRPQSAHFKLKKDLKSWWNSSHFEGSQLVFPNSIGSKVTKSASVHLGLKNCVANSELRRETPFNMFGLRAHHPTWISSPNFFEKFLYTCFKHWGKNFCPLFQFSNQGHCTLPVRHIFKKSSTIQLDNQPDTTKIPILIKFIAKSENSDFPINNDNLTNYIYTLFNMYLDHSKIQNVLLVPTA